MAVVIRIVKPQLLININRYSQTAQLHIGFHGTNVTHSQCLNIHVDSEDIILPKSPEDCNYLTSVDVLAILDILCMYIYNRFLNQKLMHIVGISNFLGKTSGR
jgi:hypothetical protein